MAYRYQAGRDDETVAVSTTELAVFGPSSWASEDAGISAQDNQITLTNLGANTCYAKSVKSGTTLSGSVSSTDRTIVIPAGETVQIHCVPGRFVVIVAATGSNSVLAQEDVIVRGYGC